MPADPPCRLTLTRSKRDLHLQTCCAIQCQTTEANPPPVDLPLRSQLVCLLVRSHLPVATGLQRARRIKFHVTILDFEISRWNNWPLSRGYFDSWPGDTL